MGRSGFGGAPADAGMKLYVGGLHFSITSEQLHALFAPFGEIEKVDLHTEGSTGQSKGYGFVHFKRASNTTSSLVVVAVAAVVAVVVVVVVAVAAVVAVVVVAVVVVVVAVVVVVVVAVELTAHYPLRTTHCPLPTAHCPLPTSHYRRPTARSASTRWTASS